MNNYVEKEDGKYIYDVPSAESELQKEEEERNKALKKLYYGKTLESFLNTAPKDQQIYVATKAGRGWIWMCTVEEFLEHMDVREYKLRKYCEDKVRIAKKKMKELPYELIEAQERVDSYLEKGDEEGAEHSQHTLRSKQKYFATYSNDLTVFQNGLDHWVKLPYRIIKEIYYKTVPGDEGIGIIVKGLEPGDRLYKDDKQAMGIWDL